MNPSFPEFLCGLAGFVAQCVVWMWFFRSRGWSFMRMVASVSIPSIVAAIAAGSLVDWGAAAPKVQPILFGFGGAAAIFVFGAWMRLSAPADERDK